MSFIGPRPLPIEYKEKYNQIQLKRFNVKPGITGWAQVNGRNDISWGDRFKLDVWYVNNMSFILDFKIIWFTILQILKSIFNEGEKESEMQVFNGTNLT